ncbi:hypothetical protein G7059_06635 [Erysipelothrix sp. HDW6A]|uniref:hypothetical protein n=1 Tax=Erysipelothrix sp. HDW6A TaxID=2714928 RepID=UPI00140B9035|nr:hypothetical protein [Erysipelothrix sp. HDW6A]QIK57541.1 hypothetical protein G7059_06635 [Erysipelothrix sp. HDW6A]
MIRKYRKHASKFIELVIIFIIVQQLFLTSSDPVTVTLGWIVVVLKVIAIVLNLGLYDDEA